MVNQKQVLISSHLFDELKAYLAKQKSHYPMRRFVDEAIEMKLKMDTQISTGEQKDEENV